MLKMLNLKDDKAGCKEMPMFDDHLKIHIQSVSDLNQEYIYALENVQNLFFNLKFSNNDYSVLFGDVANTILHVSNFVLLQLNSNPQIIHTLIDNNYLFEAASIVRYKSELHAILSAIENESQLYKALRLYRNQEMFRIAWRDIAGWTDIDNTMLETSYLAEAFITESLDYLFRKECDKKGKPITKGGDPQNLVVLGMGKLGAWELNFSSDIDLIFCYEDDGILCDKKSTTYHQFYTKLAQSLIKLFDTITEDGFIFRIDTRLRPFGESGPIVMNYDGIENYYEGQAREWERYAMVKARVVAGDYASGERLQKILTPFIYRRYLDYRAFGELRQLKRKITQELQLNERIDNIKLGYGGIREIEFIAQVFQLVRGGQEKLLRERRIQKVLDIIAELLILPPELTTKLKEYYRFFRLIENRLQQYADKQTHSIPNDDRRRAILAYGLGYDDWDDLQIKIESVRNYVHDVFIQVIDSSQPYSDDKVSFDWVEADSTSLKNKLLGIGYNNPDEILKLLSQFIQSYSIRKITDRGRLELNCLLPKILESAILHPNTSAILSRLFNLFQAIAGRNVYFALLNENAYALSQLIKLSSSSSWIVNFISTNPVLLDELLDPRNLNAPFTIERLKYELKLSLNQVDGDDIEQVLVVLRQFKITNMLRIAAADLSGAITLDVVSEYLTWLAETLLDCVLQQAWRLTAIRHGLPEGSVAEEIMGLGVIAYGKLGGRELSYASDLDLVFLYAGANDSAFTSGDNPISCPQFYAKVVKRMIMILTTHILSGTLYEIDLRLRPSGNSGLLVSSIEAYATYQMESSWTWEQQALVRARFIAGDLKIAEHFHAIRKHSLCRVRQEYTLRREVIEMRAKMRSMLEIKIPGQFDLKQASGGIADIEFIVQFGVLAKSHQHPDLSQLTDVVRLLSSLSKTGFLSPEEADFLCDAYSLFREQSHRAALLEQSAMASVDEFASVRSRVCDIWRDKIERP